MAHKIPRTLTYLVDLTITTDRTSSYVQKLIILAPQETHSALIQLERQHPHAYGILRSYDRCRFNIGDIKRAYCFFYSRNSVPPLDEINTWVNLELSRLAVPG